MKFKSALAILLSAGLSLTLCFGSLIVGIAAEDKQDSSTVDAEGDSLSKYLGVWYDKLNGYSVFTQWFKREAADYFSCLPLDFVNMDK